MDLQTVLFSVLGVILTALGTWIAERIIAWINAKLDGDKNAKYLVDAVNIVTGAVKATYQTYVQSLKDKGLFDKDAQDKALKSARNIAVEQLTEGTKNYIIEHYGDLETWITNAIESVLYDLKK